VIAQPRSGLGSAPLKSDGQGGNPLLAIQVGEALGFHVQPLSNPLERPFDRGDVVERAEQRD
jgi:hypothetical protein